MSGSSLIGRAPGGSGSVVQVRVLGSAPKEGEMKKLILAMAIVAWLGCSVVSFGTSFGYYQGKFHEIAEETRHSDLVVCSALSLFGPFALGGFFASYVVHNGDFNMFKYGLKWR